MASIPRVSSTSSELNDFTEANGKKIYNVSKSRLISLVSWVHVLSTYLPILWYVVMGVLLFQLTNTFIDMKFNFDTFYRREILTIDLSSEMIFDLGWKSMAIFALIIWYINHREKVVYLIDFATFEPPESWKMTPEETVTILRNQNTFSEESIAFQERMLKQSGCGPRTAWPPGIIRCLEGKPRIHSIEESRKEAEIVIFDVVRNVLKNTNTKPKDIDFLVVNCSLFSPTPSLCSMIINEFNMRPDISSYNLAGMGCSAGLISVELVKNLLNSRPNSTALIVSTEIITPNLYNGDEKGFLLQNILFRCGGAAVLLSNKWSDAYRSSFKLMHVIRTQYVSEDSRGCVYETEDSTNVRGVRLSKDLVKIAGRAMEKNFTMLGPYVLSVSEQFKTLFWMLVRSFIKSANGFGLKLSKVDPYIPDFKRGIDHFCIHAGGRGVIDGIEQNLKLTPQHVEASRHALYTYGNTSSSSIWYEMNYVRQHMKLYRGQRVLQIAFGSGFKCNTSVWLCINTPKKKHIDSKDKKE